MTQQLRGIYDITANDIDFEAEYIIENYVPGSIDAPAEGGVTVVALRAFIADIREFYGNGQWVTLDLDNFAFLCNEVRDAVEMENDIG